MKFSVTIRCRRIGEVISAGKLSLLSVIIIVLVSLYSPNMIMITLIDRHRKGLSANEAQVSEVIQKRKPSLFRTESTDRILSFSYQPCSVCGDSTNFVVSNADKKLEFGYTMTTCGELEKQAKAGFYFPSACRPAQEAVATNNCDCARSTKDSVSSFLQSLMKNKLVSNITTGKEINGQLSPPPSKITYSPTSSYTFSPTISNIPTSTASPTYQDKCYVCGSSYGRVTVKTQTIVVNTYRFTFDEVEVAGMSGLLSIQSCEAFTTAIRDQSLCSCQYSDYEENLLLKLKLESQQP